MTLLMAFEISHKLFVVSLLKVIMWSQICGYWIVDPVNRSKCESKVSHLQTSEMEKKTMDHDTCDGKGKCFRRAHEEIANEMSFQLIAAQLICLFFA